MDIDYVIDLTRPPFRLTIHHDDDGGYSQSVEPNGVPYGVAVIGLLAAAEKALHDNRSVCEHMAQYADELAELRERIATHVGGTMEGPE